MSSKNELKIEKLFEKASSCVGMIAEVQMKSSLIKSQLNKFNRELTEEESFEFSRRLKQIKSDLAKYSRLLDGVHKELEIYGIF